MAVLCVWEGGGEQPGRLRVGWFHELQRTLARGMGVSCHSVPGSGVIQEQRDPVPAGGDLVKGRVGTGLWITRFAHQSLVESQAPCLSNFPGSERTWAQGCEVQTPQGPENNRHNSCSRSTLAARLGGLVFVPSLEALGPAGQTSQVAETTGVRFEFWFQRLFTACRHLWN